MFDRLRYGDGGRDGSDEEGEEENDDEDAATVAATGVVLLGVPKRRRAGKRWKRRVDGEGERERTGESFLGGRPTCWFRRRPDTTSSSLAGEEEKDRNDRIERSAKEPRDMRCDVCEGRPKLSFVCQVRLSSSLAPRRHRARPSRNVCSTTRIYRAIDLRTNGRTRAVYVCVRMQREIVVSR